MQVRDPIPLSPLMPSCGYPYGAGDVGHLCGECLLNPPPFSRARALGKYEPPLLKLIVAFKYQGNRTLGQFLGQLMAEAVFPDVEMLNYDLVIPVPLHYRRLRERTFNQALILAREIAKRHTLPCLARVLVRHRYTQPQVTLAGKERAQNVSGAFSLRDPLVVKGKRILLVDDVFTTGHTLKECARVLRRGEAEEVAVLTLARVVAS